MPKKRFDPINFYPTRPIRVSIMLFLILLFFIISPLLLLYTAGYRYDFLRGIIHQTGAISIDIEPKDADVFINDLKIDQRLPIRLSNRAPGTYRLRIEKSEFHPWQKDITVESKSTMYIKDIELFAVDNPDIFFETKKEIVDWKLAPDTTGMVVVTKEADGYATRYHATDGTHRIVTISVSPTKPDVFLSPFSSTVLVQRKMQSGMRLYLVSLNRPDQIREFDVSDKAEIPFQWNKQDKEAVFIQTGATIRKITLRNENIFVGNISSPLWYVEDTEKIWYIEENTLKVSNDPEIAFHVPATDGRIRNVTNHHLLIQSRDAFFVVTLDDQIVVDAQTIPAHKANYDHQNKRWLLWSHWELWEMYDDQRPQLTARFGTKIHEVRNLNAYGALLIADEHGLKAFEPHYVTHTTLHEGLQVQNIGVLQKERGIFMLRTEDGVSKIEKRGY